MTQTPEKTLRDEFAMAALIGFLTTPEQLGKSEKNLLSTFANMSYAAADAMIAERMK